ncbi:serine hydrolase-like protein [Trachinotus anak]|uniref:serine hydrolase-like protein n=1 Tax=Trachinotus anak TaxID=443729 RepID=UPI0039F1B718
MMQTLKGARRLKSSSVTQSVSELCVPVPWGEIRGKVWGPDHGRPVLCVHGWADNCGTFNTLIPLLPKECRYVAVDLAGHGRSSHRPPGVFYSFPSYVMDVRRVVDALKWSKFSIIGHSMGGNVAGLFSAVYPEMVDAVVLLDSYGFLPTDLKEMPQVIRQGMDEMLQFEKKTEEKSRVYSYEKAAERLSAVNPTLSEQSVHILLERGLVQVGGGFVFSRDFRINLKNIVRISLEQSLEMQSRMKASILVVLAESGFEKIFAEQDQKKFTSALLQAYRDRNHMVVTVPGDHHVHLNDPGVVAPLVSHFLWTTVLTDGRSNLLCTELCVPVPWGEIRGRVWGPDLGRPVLCLHGWADNCGSFNTLVPLLPRDGRYVAVDLAGHGRSSHRPPGASYSSVEYVADVCRVADALQLEKFSIIGHSMGADIAGMFSALYPERVDALVLLDAYGFFPTDSKEVCRVMRQGMEQMIQFEKETEGKRRVYTYEKAVERLLTANPTLSEQSVHILLERGLVQVEGAGFVFSRDLRVNFKNTSRLSLEQSLEMQSRIQADVLVVLAEAGFDKIFSQPEEFTSALLQCFMDKNHKVVTVPGDHHIHLNKPEVIAPFVSDFLQTKASTNQHKL